MIHPLRAERGTALMQAVHALGDVDDSLAAGLEAERDSPLPDQEREGV